MEDAADDNELRDDGWNEQVRDETPMQRLDRNWADLLQELRVVQRAVEGHRNSARIVCPTGNGRVLEPLPSSF